LDSARGRGADVIPGRDDVANPEIHFTYRGAARWIPGSMLRIAPE